MFFIRPFYLHAQSATCNGILGTPIFKFDFGQGNQNHIWYSPLSVYAPGLSTNTIFQSGGSLPAANTSGLVRNTGAFGPPPGWLNTNTIQETQMGYCWGLICPIISEIL